MNGVATARMLAGGRRLHLQHGPIDLVVEAFGTRVECERALRQAALRFETVLAELVAELAVLRTPLCEVRPRLDGTVARRMLAATWPLRADFITPMAAVAGAVADEVLEAAVAGRRLSRAYVNNGGDIALMLAPGRTLRAALMDSPRAPLARPCGLCELHAADPARGLATSGWQGRSHSLGIADSVTVTAVNAACADAAATLVANAVDAPHPAIERRPAHTLDEDSDLGTRAVTVAVGRLDPDTVARALARGAALAEAFRLRGRIEAAVLRLAGSIRVVGRDLALRSTATGSTGATPPLHPAAAGAGDRQAAPDAGAPALG